jgi:hypothetical protein
VTDPTPPEAIREFADGVLRVEEGESYERTFEEEIVDVPARFDRESATARWGFDGRLVVTVHSAGD